jgi:hypothetical protein
MQPSTLSSRQSVSMKPSTSTAPLAKKPRMDENYNIIWSHIVYAIVSKARFARLRKMNLQGSDLFPSIDWIGESKNSHERRHQHESLADAIRNEKPQFPLDTHDMLVVEEIVRATELEQVSLYIFNIHK